MPSTKPPRIAVVCGGPSPEAEVSRRSAGAMAGALRESCALVDMLELDAGLPAALLAGGYDAVFPLAHGQLGEDGCLQGLLEVLGLAYVGSGVRASACAMHKPTAKLMFRAAGLPVAADDLVQRGEPLEAAAQRLHKQLGVSLVVKPAGLGSGLGVSLLQRAEDLLPALAQGLETHHELLVEERIIGREITAGVLEGPGIPSLPVCEIRTPQGTWYDYEHRYTEGLSQHLLPAPLPADVAAAVQAIALQAHQALGCRDLSRADFVVQDDGRIVLLEVNTLPGMTATSNFPDAARVAGIPLPQLARHLVGLALARR